ncbi:glutaredoxin 3 [Candidatus Endowatersipora endosymbiont of Watersipora subatra]|uniref:glutaredoxin 3 n=1 Tax=Candidatus Endowatersipora endosymbiont of Watersipora subatra TaxID=3077946 RepID=UPI00312CA668
MKNVIVYTKDGCCYCSAAKDLFLKKGIFFTENNATFDPVLREEMIRKSGGGTTFPQIFIGNHHIGGYDDLESMERSGELDSLLRP